MFLGHGEVYNKKQFFLPTGKENIPRKQVSHPSEQNALI